MNQGDCSFGFDFGDPRPGTSGKQPPRSLDDGPVGLKFDGETHLLLTATQSGEETELYVSIHNAWRIFGMLAIALGIQLPKKLAKSIKITSEVPAQ